MNTKILIALLAIVAAAGCTIPGIPGIVPGTSLGVGKGLEMTSFTAEPSTLYNGSTVKVIMEVENQGGSTAPATKSFAYLTGTNIKITSTDNAYWHKLSGGTETECHTFTDPLKPADIVKGTSGDRKIAKWSLRAPNVDKGTTSPNTFIGRVYTNYMTAVNGNAWAYTEAEAEAARTSGRSSNKAVFASTSGPVSLEVSATPDPLVFTSTDKVFTLKITIRNSQSGTIYKPEIITSCPPSSSLTTDDLNKVNVTITAPDFDIATECQGTTQQELVAGNPTDMLCDLTLKDASKPATYGSFPVIVKAQYGYYTERSVSVTVQGK